jgi:hypothetical protein
MRCAQLAAECTQATRHVKQIISRVDNYKRRNVAQAIIRVEWIYIMRATTRQGDAHKISSEMQRDALLYEIEVKALSDSC